MIYLFWLLVFFTSIFCIGVFCQCISMFKDDIKRNFGIFFLMVLLFPVFLFIAFVNAIMYSLKIFLEIGYYKEPDMFSICNYSKDYETKLFGLGLKYHEGISRDNIQYTGYVLKTNKRTMPDIILAKAIDAEGNEYLRASIYVKNSETSFIKQRLIALRNTYTPEVENGKEN